MNYHTQHKDKKIIKTAGAVLMAIGMIATPWLSSAQNINAKVRPVISGLTAPAVLSVDQEGTWTVKASDQYDRPLTYSVDWGDSPTMGLKAQSETPFVQSATFTHAYAMSGVYQVKFLVKNENGLTAGTSATVRVNKGNQQVLLISNLVATSTGPNTAKISWDTNLRAKSNLWFGTSTPDTSRDPNIVREGKVLHHSIVLNKLVAGTMYYVIVGSPDRNGNNVLSAQISFMTQPRTDKNPRIISIEGPTSLTAETEGTWTINASDPKNRLLTYAVDWGDTPTTSAFRAESRSAFVQSTTFTHAYSEAGTYNIKFMVMNDLNLTAEKTTSVNILAASTTETKKS